MWHLINHRWACPCTTSKKRLVCIGYAMKCHRTLRIGSSFSTMEDGLSWCDVVGVINLVVHKISIDPAIERWAPVICISGFIFNGCWAETAGIDDLNAAFHVRSMAPRNGLDHWNGFVFAHMRSDWLLPLVENHQNRSVGLLVHLRRIVWMWCCQPFQFENMCSNICICVAQVDTLKPSVTRALICCLRCSSTKSWCITNLRFFSWADASLLVALLASSFMVSKKCHKRSHTSALLDFCLQAWMSCSLINQQ